MGNIKNDIQRHRFIQIIKIFIRLALPPIFFICSISSASAETFNYNVPSHWEKPSENIRAKMETTTKQGMMALEGQGVGYQIERFYTFTIRRSCIVFIYNLVLPKGSIATNELDRSKELSISKFEAGKKSGIVRDIISIERQNVGDLTGNVFEWIGKTESPLKQIMDTSWHHPAIPNKLINVSSQCTENGHADGKNEIFDLVRSISVQP